MLLNASAISAFTTVFIIAPIFNFIHDVMPAQKLRPPPDQSLPLEEE